MKAYLPGIFAASLGLLAGFLLARGSDAGPDEVQPPSGNSAKSRPPRVPAKALLAEPRKAERRLATLLNLDRRRLNLDETDRKLMAAGNSELKELLTGLIALDKSAPSLTVNNLRNSVIREIYHREGPASLEAAAQRGDPGTLGEFILCLAREDALAAAGWLERLKQVIRDHHSTLAGVDLAIMERNELITVMSHLYGSALYQGAEVAVAVHKHFGDSAEQGSWMNSLPHDFDHATYLGALDPQRLPRIPNAKDHFESWAMHDRDAALALALRTVADAPPGSVHLPFAVFEGVCKLDGEQAAAAWLSESLAPLPESDRAQVLSRFFEYQAPSPDGFRDILAGLLNDTDRFCFGATVLNPRLPADQITTYLDGVPSTDLRAGILEVSSRKWAEKPLSEEQRTEYRATFETLTSAARIPEEARARVMAMWP